MRTLLLADESTTVQRVIALTFAEQPIRVIAVSDGQQAIEKIAAQRPDIILASTTLSVVSGYDLARFAQGQPELQEVPVLLLSGAFETVDEAKLETSGAVGVIEKPVEPIAVIRLVKELLGLKSADKPATGGRLFTSVEGPSEKKPPVETPAEPEAPKLDPPPPVEQAREQVTMQADPPPVDPPATKSEDYLNTLGTAFDSLDHQLLGGTAARPGTPADPAGRAAGVAETRSPERIPGSSTEPGSPVFEVDDEWFGETESAAQADARSGRREFVEDLRSPELQMPATDSTPAPIFEVDEDWFSVDNDARAARLQEQRELAAAMGIHDVELPPLKPAVVDLSVPTVPVVKSDFDFGLDDLKAIVQAAPAADVAPVVEDAASAPAPAVVEIASVPPVTANVPPAPVWPSESAGSATPIEPSWQYEPTRPVEHVAPAEPSAFVEPPSPVESNAPVEATAPVEVVAQTEPASLIEPFAPFEAITPIEPAAPVETTMPGELIAAAESSPSIESFIATEPAALVESAASFASTSQIDEPVPVVPEPAIEPVVTAADPGGVADDFAALLAYEQGEPDGRKAVEEPVSVPAPEITDAMLEQIAARVAELLSSGPLGDQLKTTITETVRSVVSEVSERLVRDEIDRIKSRS